MDFKLPPPCLLYLALYIFMPLNPLLNKTTQDADTSYMTWAIYGGPDALTSCSENACIIFCSRGGGKTYTRRPIIFLLEIEAFN